MRSLPIDTDHAHSTDMLTLALHERVTQVRARGACTRTPIVYITPVGPVMQHRHRKQNLRIRKMVCKPVDRGDHNSLAQIQSCLRQGMPTSSTQVDEALLTHLLLVVV